MKKIEVIQADIITLQVDAVVNAANTSLLGGGGVDGAIHRAAGPGLLAECKKIGGCPTGEAKITKGHDLPSRFVIHTVGPVWHGGQRGEDSLLASCYCNCFQIASQSGLKTIAFPAISTGAYGFPKKEAAAIAIAEAKTALRRYPVIEKVMFVCIDGEMAQLYHELIDSTDEEYHGGS